MLLLRALLGLAADAVSGNIAVGGNSEACPLSATAYVVFHVFAAHALNAATALCESDAGRCGFGSH